MENVKMNNHSISPSIRSFAFTTKIPPRNELTAFLCNVDAPPKDSFYQDLPSHWRVAKCRSLVRECSHFLAMPMVPSNKVTIVCSKTFAALGNPHTILASFGISVSQRNVELSDKTFKALLEFAIVGRLSPDWNRVDLNLLVYNEDFLTMVIGIPAIKFLLSIHGTEAQILLQPLKVKLPMLQACDLEMNDTQSVCDFFARKLRQVFDNCVDLEWVHTLPSMKPARVMSVSHHIPDTSPLKSYADFTKMWQEVYGYKLPPPDEGRADSSLAGPYLNVKYDVRGLADNSREHTYPAICVRPYETLFFRNVDQHLVLTVFIHTLMKTCPIVCGFNLNWVSQKKVNLSPEVKQEANNSKELCEKVIDEIVAAIKRDQAMGSHLSIEQQMPPTNPKPQPLPICNPVALIQPIRAESSVPPQVSNSSGLSEHIEPQPVSNQIDVMMPQEDMSLEISSTQLLSAVPMQSNLIPIEFVIYSAPALPRIIPSISPSYPKNSAQNVVPIRPAPVSRKNMVQTRSLFASGTGEVSSSRQTPLRAAARNSILGRARPPREAQSSVLTMKKVNMAEFVKCRRVDRFRCDELRQWLLEKKVTFSPRAPKKDLIQAVYNRVNQPAAPANTPNADN
ncbi:uncharacterized protein LOC135939171 isoform X2 [Cloeon dipterum]|uniref:uncharacterized protein LOC135939171 isoform X2 n=1 Tax=Cloeon dipterum TaxID=197152 RepID=UPI00321FC3A4